MTVSTTATTPLEITIHPQTPPGGQFWSNDAPSFKDVLDTINPLQHIPIVSTLYQSLTGDIPSTGSKLAGGALFGGPIGFVTSLFDSIIQNATGADTMGNIMAAIEGKPVPLLHNSSTETASTTPGAPPDHLSPNQRGAYNAYVQTQNLLS